MPRRMTSLSKIKCRVCKEWFVPNASSTVMCSSICRFINRREWESDYNKKKAAIRRKKVKKIKCRNCKKSFLPASKTRAFCSRECSRKFNIYKRKPGSVSPSEQLRKHKYRNYEFSENLNTPEQKELHRLELNVAIEKFLKDGGKIDYYPPLPLPQIPSVGSRDWPWEYMIGLGYYGMEELTEPEVNIEDLIKK